MRGGERRHAENMHVVFHRLARGFRRRRKQRPDIDVEAEIGEGRGDHLLPAVVAVLADLGDQQARPAALRRLERLDRNAHPFDRAGHADLPLVDAGDRLDLGAVTPVHLLQRRGNLADGGLGAGGVDRQRQEIAVAAVGGAGERVERLLQRRRIALGLQPLELVELHLHDGGIVDLEHVDRRFVGRLVFVDADHRLLAASRCAPASWRRLPRCAAWECRPRSPWSCRRALRLPRYGPRPSSRVRR